MEIIAGYVKTISFFMIFGAFIEIIAPSGSFKKYIRLILSLTLIALLLEPISALLNAARFEDVFLKQQNNVDNMMTIKREEYERSQAEMVIGEYKKNLTEQVTQIVEARAGFKVINAAVIVNEDYQSESFAEILGIHITAQLPEGAGEQGAVRSALLGNASSKAVTDDMINTAVLNIKNSISDFYNIQDGNIHITVQGG